MSGGQADKETIEERAGRALASALFPRSNWYAVMAPEGNRIDVEGQPGNDEGLRIAWRWRVQEPADEARGLRQFRRWGYGSRVYERPAQASLDAIAALSFARLTRPQEAILRVYAGQLEQWPTVEQYMRERGHSREASSDAMDRILWKRPDVTLAERARRLHRRKADYLLEVREAKRALLPLLREAGRKFLRARGNRKHRADSYLCRRDEFALPCKLPRTVAASAPNAASIQACQNATRADRALEPESIGTVVHTEEKENTSCHRI